MVTPEAPASLSREQVSKRIGRDGRSYASSVPFHLLSTTDLGATALVLKADLFTFTLIPTRVIGFGQDPNRVGVPTWLEEDRTRVVPDAIARIRKLAIDPSPRRHLNPCKVPVGKCRAWRPLLLRISG